MEQSHHEQQHINITCDSVIEMRLLSLQKLSITAAAHQLVCFICEVTLVDVKYLAKFVWIFLQNLFILKILSEAGVLVIA